MKSLRTRSTIFRIGQEQTELHPSLQSAWGRGPQAARGIDRSARSVAFLNQIMLTSIRWTRLGSENLDKFSKTLENRRSRGKTEDLDPLTSTLNR